MSTDELVARALALIPGATPAPAELVRGQAVVIVPRERLADGLRALRDDPALRFDRLSDVTAVDYFPQEPRFAVVYQLHSLVHGHRLRLKVPVPGDDPEVASAVPLWRSALWAEREVWDMFGIRFRGHPDLRRILLYPEFQGHPLRKDYPVDRRQPLVPERDPIEAPWPRRAGA
jgi:NADH-quinone oxidoreductase subunit C